MKDETDHFIDPPDNRTIKNLEVAGRSIGPGSSCFVIAEIAQAHDGSLGLAHQHIEVAARSGVSAVKFQTHLADAESTPEEPWRVNFSKQDTTRQDYWRRMEFTLPQWRELKAHAETLGLIFLSSPFSELAVDWLESIDMPAYKIASGEMNNPILLKRIAETGKPVILSSGMSDVDELSRVVSFFVEQEVPTALLQCTTAYPCPPEKIGLEWIRRFHDRFRVPVGLSDHSGQIYAGLAAVTLGASILEVHLALHPDMFGPDVPASLLPEQLTELCRGVRDIETMLSHSVRKDTTDATTEQLRRTFGKSLHVTADLPAGHQVTWGDLTGKKPGIGIPVAEAEQWVGRTLAHAVGEGQRLQPGDFR